MTRIFFDTNLFIYLLEGAGASLQLVRSLRARMQERRDELLTSTLTLGEILVKPMEMAGAARAAQIESFFESEGIRLVPFDRSAARAYATIRRDRSIRAPDAIQLACAAAAGTNLFVTNDMQLSKKVIPGIDFIVPLDRVFL